MSVQITETASLYEKMLLIRRFEERCGRLYMESKIRGFLHLYIGEEAVAVGAISALTEDDYVVTHYRDHGHALARGLDPKAIMAELMGKSTGCSGGRGGSMHLFDISKRFMGGYAIVGGQLPIAVGLAISSKYRKDSAVTICFFGDGALNEGEFHESMNLASLWKAPVLFFLENNLYGMGSHVNRTHSAGADLYTFADPYKIPAAQVDGMDVIAVKNATSQAIKRIREGEGPHLIEAMTYRFAGHSLTDPTTYRDAAEVNKWKEKDPIKKFKEESLANNLLTKDQITEIDVRVNKSVEDAVDFAEGSEEAPLKSLHDNVYA